MSILHLRQLQERPRLDRQDREQHSEKNVNRKELADRLREVISGEVRFDRGSRALYCTDGSNYRQVPIGVVLPRSIEDVVQTIRICRDLQHPLLSRGGGTSLAGQSCNVAVIMDFSKYLPITVLEIDAARKLARVQPGCVLDDLREAAKKRGLNFGPDPATHSRCTLGGMLRNNSCGCAFSPLFARRAGIPNE